MKTLLEVDDLWNRKQIEELLVPLRKANTNVLVNAFTIPNKFGPVTEIKKLFPWINFCIHGFEHTHYECLEWTYEKACALIGKALEMGYEPVFKAPNHYLDKEVEAACVASKVALIHDHSYKPYMKGTHTYECKLHTLDHTRLSAHLVAYPGSRDFILDHPSFKPEVFKDFDGFLSYQELLNG